VWYNCIKKTKEGYNMEELTVHREL